MPLSPENEKLFNVLANDPEDVKILIQRAAKHEELATHPAVREHKTLRQVETPLMEEITALKKEVTNLKQQTWEEREFDSLRKGPFHFNQAKIDALKKRIAEDSDGPAFRSYTQAAEYYRRADSPLGPSTVNFGQEFGIAPTTSNSDQQWREDMQNPDPKLNPLKMDRRTRKLYVRKLAQAASEDFKQSLGR